MAPMEFLKTYYDTSWGTQGCKDKSTGIMSGVLVWSHYKVTAPAKGSAWSLLKTETLNHHHWIIKEKTSMRKEKWLGRKKYAVKDDGLFIQPMLVFIFALILWRRKAITVQSGLKQASNRQQESTKRKYSQTQLGSRGTLLAAQPSTAIGNCRDNWSFCFGAASWTECHTETLPKLGSESLLL